MAISVGWITNDLPGADQTRPNEHLDGQVESTGDNRIENESPLARESSPITSSCADFVTTSPG